MSLRRRKGPASQMLSPPEEVPSSGVDADADADAESTHNLMESAAKPLKCDRCDRSFSRPSHLNRHLVTHLPPSQRNSIRCPRCTRVFSRNDVLLRHLRSSHDLDVGPKASYQKSCNRCVQKKLKCDRAMPCRSCAVATTDVVCVYPISDDGPDVRLSPDFSDREQSLIQAIPVRGLPKDCGSPQPLHSSALPISRKLEAPDDFAMQATSASAIDGTAPGISGDNRLAPVFSELVDGPPSFTIASSIASPGQLDCKAQMVDWLAFDFPNNEPTSYNWGDGNLGPGNMTPGILSNPLGPYIPPGDILPPVAPSPTVLPWPFDQGQEVCGNNTPLPSLRQVLEQVVQDCAGDESIALEGLAQLFSEHRLPRREQQLEPSASLGLDFLDNMLDSFFTNFQPIQPMIHIPTWDKRESPTTLLASMACIGAVQSRRHNAAELAASISGLCTRMINWAGFSDDASYTNIFYLATLCLHQIYSLGSGSRQLYQHADRTRGVLIGSLRGLNLLTSQLRIHGDEADDVPQPLMMEPALLHGEWLSWIQYEQARRIAWASFEYDCSLCTLTGRRGIVDLSELPSALPCLDVLWEARSATEWAMLRSRLPLNATGAQLSSVLQAVTSCNSRLDHVSVWGKRISSQVIGRLLWDMKQLEVISAREYFGLPSLFKAQQHSKQPLLGGLDCLLESMTGRLTKPQLMSYNISGLLCHYSHLYAAEDIMDMILSIVRNTVSGGNRPGKGIWLAKRRLVESLASDPTRSRRLLWHAGQILAIANEYLVPAPCEIMRLFMGYIFIIASAKYLPRQYLSGRFKVKIDRPGHVDDPGIASWIQNGGPVQMGLAEDLTMQGATALIAQDARLIFNRLSGWGLSEKFAGIVQCFEESNT